MEDGVGGPSGCSDASDRIFDGGLGDDLRRLDIAAEEFENHFTRTLAGCRFGGVCCRHSGWTDWGDAKKFADQSHGVGGELPAARSSPGARGFFEGE